MGEVLPLFSESVSERRLAGDAVAVNKMGELVDIRDIPLV